MVDIHEISTSEPVNQKKKKRRKKKGKKGTKHLKSTLRHHGIVSCFGSNV